MDFLPKQQFRRCVERYHVNHRTRSFSCLSQFLCMAFAQLTFRESLRDIETCLAADLSRHLAERLDVAQRACKREIRPVLLALPADEKLIDVTDCLVAILNRDLQAAGIDKADERGRTFDVHAFRTTFNSLLATAGVAPATRRLLMRHAAEGVTDEHYTGVQLIDLRVELDNLPGLPLDGGQAKAGRAVAVSGG